MRNSLINIPGVHWQFCPTFSTRGNINLLSNWNIDIDNNNKPVPENIMEEPTNEVTEDQQWGWKGNDYFKKVGGIPRLVAIYPVVGNQLTYFNMFEVMFIGRDFVKDIIIEATSKNLDKKINLG